MHHNAERKLCRRAGAVPKIHCFLCAQLADVGASPHTPGRAVPSQQHCFCNSWGCRHRKQGSHKQLEQQRILQEFSVILQKPFDNWEYVQGIKPLDPALFLGAPPRNPDWHDGTSGFPREMHLCMSWTLPVPKLWDVFSEHSRVFGVRTGLGRGKWGMRRTRVPPNGQSQRAQERLIDELGFASFYLHVTTAVLGNRAENQPSETPSRVLPAD